MSLDMGAYRHAAAQGLVPAAPLPWEADVVPSTEPEAWLLSFVDVLILLLTLFVLLLAYQHNQADRTDDAPRPVPARVERSPGPVAGPAAGQVEKLTAATVSLEPGDVPAEAAPEAEMHIAKGRTDTARGVHGQAALDGTTPTDDGTAAAVGRNPHTGSQGEPGLTSEWVGAAVDSLLMHVAPGLPVIRSVWLSHFDMAARATGEISAYVAMPAAVASVDTAPPATPAAVIQELHAALTAGGFEGRAEIQVQPGALRLDVSDRILFAPASADLTGEGLALLDELATLLHAQTFTLSVEGHTDAVPIHTARYPSNWELASARATEVTRRLIARGIAPERLRAIGYADTRPRAANDSAAGRARNRRVAFVLELP